MDELELVPDVLLDDDPVPDDPVLDDPVRLVVLLLDGLVVGVEEVVGREPEDDDTLPDVLSDEIDTGPVTEEEDGPLVEVITGPVVRGVLPVTSKSSEKGRVYDE